MNLLVPVFAAGLLLTPAAPAPASPAASVPELLAGTDLLVVDVEAARELGRFRVARAALAGRCTLRLRAEPAGAGPLAIALGDLRFVQGDGRAVEISTRRERRRSLIFEVGAGRYAAAMGRLAGLARSCGARLAEPPPLIATPRR